MILGVVGEALLQLHFAAVAQMADPAGDRQAGNGPALRVVIVAVSEIRVEADRLVLQPAEGDLFGAGGCARGDHDRPLDLGGKVHGPLDGAHPTHGAAEHGVPSLDSELGSEGALDGDLILHCHDRKTGSVRPPVSRPGARTGCPLAASEDVRADDEVAARVNRRTRADEGTPPARTRMPRFDRSAHV